MTVQFTEADSSGLLLQIDLGVYSMGALLKVAYGFTGRCYLHLQKTTPTTVQVRLRSKKDTHDLKAIAGDFCNEVLDQTLREIIAKESEPERNLILAHALSRTTLLHPELEAATLFTNADPNATSCHGRMAEA